MGQLIPLDGYITMALIGAILILGVKSCVQHYYLIALSFIISLIGARLASYYYSLELHIYAMTASLLLLIFIQDYRLIGFAYIPRILIALVGVNHHASYMEYVFLISEFFLVVQLLLWISILRGNNGGGKSNRSTLNYRNTSYFILVRCRVLAGKLRKTYNQTIQEKELK